MKLVYDSWFTVHITCKKYVAQSVQLGLNEELSSQHRQFPATNEVLLALGHKRIAGLKVLTPLSVSSTYLSFSSV